VALLPPRCGRDCVSASRSLRVRSTLMTTAECLLNKNRNPTWSQAELEQHLKDMLAVRKVLWLPRGLYKDDDTNGDPPDPEEHLALIAMSLDAACMPPSA